MNAFENTCERAPQDSTGSDWVWQLKGGEWPFSPVEARAPQPGRTYTKRSSHLADLRAKAQWATANADAFISPPSDLAQATAKSFINHLPDGCLDFELALSQSGEINFFFGQGEHLVQILIDESGALSFYGKFEGFELAGSDIEPADFPYFRLLKFVDRNK